jgi:hypothetical protein
MGDLDVRVRRLVGHLRTTAGAASAVALAALPILLVACNPTKGGY